MRYPEKRKEIMARSIALGHCVCNPRQPCPCDVLIKFDLCPCAGERSDPPKEEVKLTSHVRKAGCASKINHNDLNRVLAQLPDCPDPNVLLGVAAGDDAGVYHIDGEYNLVQTVDVFSPVIDDPYVFGQICASNSVSDVYAMGGKPICALSIIGFPIEELPHETMSEILRGGIDTLREAGVSVIGGHSINDEEVKCGFAITGLIKGNGSITNSQAQIGDALVLTKPIGTGIIAFSAQIGRASQEAVELIGKSMAELNKNAAELMVQYGAHSCTDVTGFSLIGHLSEMVRRSGVCARIDTSKIPFFAEALAGIRQGIVPGAIDRNMEAFADNVQTMGNGDGNILSLLYDAQTSGGLLIALPEEKADDFIRDMLSRGHNSTSKIGQICERQDKLIQIVLNEPTNLIGTYQEIKTPVGNYTENVGVDLRVYPTQTVEQPPEDFACCEHPPETGSESGRSEMGSNDSRRGDSGIAPDSGIALSQQSADSFKQFMKSINTPGYLDAKTKRLLNIALAVATRCDHCLEIHIEHALSQQITRGEIDEAAWLAISFGGAPAKLFYEGIWRDLKNKAKLEIST